MNRFFMVLVIVGLVSAGAFADVNIGVGVNATTDAFADPLAFAEVGIDNGTVGIYADLGMTALAGLVGVNVRLGDSPFMLFGGLGGKVVNNYNVYSYDSKTKTNVKIDAYQETASYNWFSYETSSSSFNLRYNNVETASAFSEWVSQSVVPYGEAGLMVDMEIFYTKIGWTNYAGNAMTMSFGVRL